MTRTDNDVLTIGNAIVDILSQIDDDFLVRENLVKGSMRLIDQTEADRLFAMDLLAHIDVATKPYFIQ